MEKLLPLKELFTPVYGANLELVNVDPCEKNGPDCIRFVSRSEKNNGVSAFVKRLDEVNPNPAHTISVATSGSVLSAFYQPDEYYSGRDLYYLVPKRQMSVEEMVFYAFCISTNKYKYNYGRAANRTLGDLLLPREMPIKWRNISVKDIPVPTVKHGNKVKLQPVNWKTFKYGGIRGIFDIRNGYYNKKPEHTEAGNIPFVGASMFNNGITEYYSSFDIEKTNKSAEGGDHDISQKIFKGNCVTVVNNGVGVGHAFYQPRDFTCSHDVNVLYLRDREWSVNIALFICTLIKLESYRWAYGRKWRPSRMPFSEIKLPVNSEGAINWDYIEEFMESLPYSISEIMSEVHGK